MWKNALKVRFGPRSHVLETNGLKQNIEKSLQPHLHHIPHIQAVRNVSWRGTANTVSKKEHVRIT